MLLAGCAGLLTSATARLANNLSTAILEQDDPQLVATGLPSYLLLLDSLIIGDPDSAAALSAAAQMYAAYAVTFVDDNERAARLSARGFEYGQRALCVRHKPSCRWSEHDFDAFVAALRQVDAGETDVLYAYTISWLAWLRTNSGDWSALTDLPRVEAMLVRLQGLDEPDQRASVNLYLGVLNTLRPPALGGDPEKGRNYFERAIELSGGNDLSAKVEFARGYARLVYDRELHDRLLKEVLAADARAPSLTLTNILAQQQARELLKSADEYF